MKKRWAIPLIILMQAYAPSVRADSRYALLDGQPYLDLARIVRNINFADYYASLDSLPYSLQPLNKAYEASKNGDTIFVPKASWPWSNEMFADAKGKSVLFYLLGQAHSGNAPDGSAPPSYITPHSVTEGFWNGSVNLQKSIPLEHNHSSNNNWDYNPLLNINYEVNDVYQQISCPFWCGRLDVPGLLVHAREGVNSKASSVPIIASLDTYGSGGFFANSVALKTYTNNYGINASWGIDIRSTDYSGVEPHDDGHSPGGYSLIGEETDLQASGQDTPNIQYVPFGYRRFYHLGGGISDTNEASWGQNTCAYSFGTRVIMPEYTAQGQPILDPWGHQLRGVFKVRRVKNPCSQKSWGALGKTGLSIPEKWVREAGKIQEWTQQPDKTYVLRDIQPALPPVEDGDVEWEWGEDENATIGTGILLDGVSVRENISKGQPGAQYGAGMYLKGSFLDAAIDLSAMECGIQINDLASGKNKYIPQTKCASIRTPVNIPIDFSANSTNNAMAARSQNQHTLGYYDQDKSLEYKSFSKKNFTIKDNGGVVLNKMTKKEIQNISSPDDGEIVFDTTDSVLVIYINKKWHKINLGSTL